MDLVSRFDLAAGTVSGHRRTPQGGLIADGRLTRTGVLTYVQPDGSAHRELRPPEEVFDAASLATLAHAPVTIDHPDQVTPRNWRKVAVGHVAGTPKRDGTFVAAELRLHDADAIDGAERGDLQEISCGYQCRLDHTPGEYQGEHYDAVQRGIRYNHVALGPAGFGRAGPEVRMRLDSGAAVSGAGELLEDVDGLTPEQREALDRYVNERTDTGMDEHFDTTDDGSDPIAEARDAMLARNKDAWKTGKKWDRRRDRGGPSGSIDPNGIDPAKAYAAREAAERAPFRAKEAAKTRATNGGQPRTVPFTYGSISEATREEEVGTDDAVAEAQQRMVARNASAWKTGKKRDRRAGRR